MENRVIPPFICVVERSKKGGCAKFNGTCTAKFNWSCSRRRSSRNNKTHITAALHCIAFIYDHVNRKWSTLIWQAQFHGPFFKKQAQDKQCGGVLSEVMFAMQCRATRWQTLNKLKILAQPPTNSHIFSIKCNENGFECHINIWVSAQHICTGWDDILWLAS